MNSQNSIYLHIGTHKTGTSAIQDFLAINKKVLNKKGILYPQRSRRSYYTRIDDGYCVTKSNCRYFKKLESLCRKKRKSVLFSSETFSYLTNVSDLGPLFDGVDVKVICYLRRQDNVLQSMYNQSVKRGSFFGEILEYPMEILDYYDLLGRWASVFGRENMIVRVYEKEQFVNGSLIEDFLSILGLKLTDEFVMPKRNPNPRLSPVVLEYMRYINSLLKDVKASIKLKKSLVKFSAEKYSHVSTSVFFDHSLLTDDQRQSILDKYADSNALVAKKYLGRKDGRLFYEELKSINRETSLRPTLTDEMVLEITSYVCRNKKHKRVLLRAVKQDVSQRDSFAKDAQLKLSDALSKIGY